MEYFNKIKFAYSEVVPSSYFLRVFQHYKTLFGNLYNYEPTYNNIGQLVRIYLFWLKNRYLFVQL